MKYLFLLFSLFLPFSGTTQSQLRFLSATTGAACYDILYFNNHLFAGTGNTLMVFDLDTNNEPNQQVFEYRFTSNIDDMQVKGSKLFVAANHAGLSMWDISNFANITMLDEYIPDSLNEAAYNIAFYGDSVFVAYKSKMALFKDNGSTLSLLTKFSYQSGTSKIRGCAVKGNLLAFVSAFGSNPQTGVHLYNAFTLSEYSFYQQDFCDPEDLVFGKNTNLLHVAGGTESLASFGFNANGLFYSLDMTNPGLPVEVFRDTLPGIIGLAISQPMNLANVNDTIFVATQAALDANFQGGDTLSGQVYIYDCTNPSSVSFINSVNGGLWHFDIAVNSNRLYVASEWYGIQTDDITDIINEVYLGRKGTGGWNLGSDKFGNRLVVGNEGYGVKLFDFSNPSSPALLATDNTGGFCMNVDYSKNGDYIFGWYWTLDDFRVLDPNNLSTLASIPIVNSGVADYRRTQIWQDKAVGIQIAGSNKSIIVIDVSNPLVPFVDTTLPMNNILDIFINGNGKLFAATKDSLVILDLNNNLSQLAKIDPPSNFFNDFTALAGYKDTLFVYLSGLSGGIFNYYYNGANLLTPVSNIIHPIVNYSPIFMAADSFGLYLVYTEQGLYSFNKQSLTQTGYYRHGMEFVHNFLWGPQDIFCKDKMIFLVEYFGQTTVLTFDDQITSADQDLKSGLTKGLNGITVYPNPAGDHITVGSGKNSQSSQIRIFNSGGAWIHSYRTTGIKKINISHLSSGTYAIEVGTEITFFQKK